MSRYVPADFFLLRSPALPMETFLEFMRDPDRTDGELLRLAQDPSVRRALFVASEDFAEGLSRIDRMSPKSVARVHSRLWRYLTRMSTRPTPFGAFSGVAMGTFSRGTTMQLENPAISSARVRADMGWILACIQHLEDDPAIWKSLRIVRNATAHVSGDRVVLPHADVYGKSDRTSVRVRATPAVHAVLEAARTPVRYAEIIDALSAACPEADDAAKENLVRQLWDLNFLTSDLRPPQTSARPERYLLDRLTGIPQAADAAERLREIVDLVEQADDPASLTALRTAQEKLVPGYTGQTYQLDSVIGLRAAELDESVASAAADAVDVLMRLSAATGGGNTHLAQYREEFLERYGQGARVPVLELLSPDQGLDAPPSYTEPPRTSAAPGNPPSPDTSHYDQAIVEFARQAWWNRSLEVELTDAWLDRLAPDASTGPLLPVMDLYLQIEAADRQAIDRGEWRAVVRADGLAHGGRTFGRFFDMLGGELVDRLRDFARREEALLPEVAYAELAYLPTYGRAGNVAAHPGLRTYEIPVNTSPSVPADRVLPLDDILVGADERRFHLWSRRLGREVVVTQHHMLSPLAAPNVARFLLEASQDGYVMPGGFHWGPVSGAAFLPRVTRGKVVLRPAQWRLDSHDLDDLAAWRERWHVPRHVYLVEHDNRLLLDLDHPRCVGELREEVRRKGGAAVLLHEMLPDFTTCWLGDGDTGQRYTEEIVVPVIAAGPEVVARSGIGPRVEIPSRRYLPGSAWSYLKLYAAVERHDEIIAGPLRALIAELRAEDAVDRWFYIRYADPRPHLRIRVRSSRSWMLSRLGAWGKSVVDSGLAQDAAMDSYCPETMRYGGIDTFDAVEHLFEANSDATAELIAHRPEMRDEHLAVAAVDTLYSQWGIPLGERMDLLPGHADDSGTREDFKKSRDYLCELLMPWDRYTHETGRAHRLRIAQAFAAQEAVVRAASAAVRQATEEDRLAVSPAHVIGSLAHMQVNRLLSVDLAREERCYGLLRHTLRALRGRLAAEEGS